MQAMEDLGNAASLFDAGLDGGHENEALSFLDNHAFLGEGGGGGGGSGGRSAEEAVILNSIDYQRFAADMEEKQVGPRIWDERCASFCSKILLWKSNFYK